MGDGVGDAAGNAARVKRAEGRRVDKKEAEEEKGVGQTVKKRDVSSRRGGEGR